MSDESRRVLELLAQGKITVDEADQLLRAVGAPPPDTAEKPREGDGQKLRFLRITVHKPANAFRGEKDVNVRVPIAIVRSGMRLGSLIPGLAGDEVAARLKEKGLDADFSKLDAAAVESILRELADTNIEIDSGRAQVRITCE